LPGRLAARMPDRAIDRQRAHCGPRWPRHRDGIEPQVAKAGGAGRRAPQDALPPARGGPPLTPPQRTSVRSRLRLGRVQGVAFPFLPAELDLAAHLRPGRHREAPRLEIADQRARLLELDPGICDEVTTNLAAHQHRVGLDLAVDGCAGLDRQLTLDVDVSLEAAGDADVAVPLNLSLDGEARGED